MTQQINWNRRKYTQQQFEQAWQQAETLHEVTQLLGFKTVSKNLYTTLRKTATTLQLKDKFDAYDNVSDPPKPSKSTLTAILEKGDTKYCCKICGIDTWLGLPLSLHVDHIDGDHTNNNIENLRYLCPNCHTQTKTFGRGIPDYSKRPLQPLNRIYKKPHNAVFAKNTKYDKPVRTRIINECLITYKCGICNIHAYNNTHLNLQIDHIDGDRTNNELENLRFLCPNCHSQTDTYCGKNSDWSHIVKNKCIDCGEEMVEQRATRCRSCFKKYNRRNIPPIDKILEVFEETGFNFVRTGKHFQVSDNAVRKWIISAGLPSRPMELKKYILEEKES